MHEQRDWFRLDDRHALVGGATQGIGRACAIALARAGARVTITGRNDEGLAKVAGELAAIGPGHSTVLVDHADWQAVQRSIDALAARDPVHVVVHNTGGPAAGFAIDADPSLFSAALSQHVATGQAIMQACAPGMRAAGFGRLVSITSTSVTTPLRVSTENSLVEPTSPAVVYSVWPSRDHCSVSAERSQFEAISRFWPVSTSISTIW